MLEEVQALRDALGNGAVHEALAAVVLRLHERVSLLERPEDDPAETPEGGE